ncbi:MAG TPA: TetR/AcrR family transcriptional regulator [Limnobacter sp.]|nr:TetR/AcrR family transcriptional regulator [Limnobacter sp.]
MSENNLRTQCIQLAFDELDQGNIGALSLRAMARSLGVSHQAPYRHFVSKDDLMRCLRDECFIHFAASLEARPQGKHPWLNLRSMGVAYVQYALDFPHRYRMMFEPLAAESNPDAGTLGHAQAAFLILRKQLEAIKKSLPNNSRLDPQADAMFIWSCLHGLVSLLENPLTDTLPVRESVLKNLVEHVLNRLGDALGRA